MRLFHSETNDFGVTKRFYSDGNGNVTVEHVQDLTPIFERNKAVANDRGKRITSDYANPVAFLPHVVVTKWLNEEGWFAYDADKDPDVDKKLKAKLNDPEWRWLRTSELTV